MQKGFGIAIADIAGSAGFTPRARFWMVVDFAHEDHPELTVRRGHWLRPTLG